MQPGKAGGNQLQERRRNLDLLQIDNLGPECVGDRLVKLRFIDDPVVEHRALDCFAVLGRFEENVIGLGAIHQALVDEEVDDAFVIHV